MGGGLVPAHSDSMDMQFVRTNTANVGLVEGTHKVGRNKMHCKAATHDVHVVMPDGKIKRCQLAKTRTFPFFDVEYEWDERREHILGIKTVTLKPAMIAAGFSFLEEDFAAEGNAEGYELYKRWEATCDSIKHKSAAEKKKLIPDITSSLPKSVLERRSNDRGAFSFMPQPEKKSAKRT